MKKVLRSVSATAKTKEEAALIKSYKVHLVKTGKDLSEEFFKFMRRSLSSADEGSKYLTQPELNAILKDGEYISMDTLRRHRRDGFLEGMYIKGTSGHVMYDKKKIMKYLNKTKPYTQRKARVK